MLKIGIIRNYFKKNPDAVLTSRQIYGALFEDCPSTHIGTVRSITNLLASDGFLKMALRNARVGHLYMLSDDECEKLGESINEIEVVVEQADECESGALRHQMMCGAW